MPSPTTHTQWTGRHTPNARSRTASRSIVVREYDELTGLDKDEKRDLERFALERATEKKGWVLMLQNGLLKAQNYVGVLETRQGTVVEILPKVDLSDDGDENTREVFMTMLRDWRGLKGAQWKGASIRAKRRLDMFEAFVDQFLTNVILLTRRGLARTYRTQEANLQCLRGRILFPAHIRENLVDRSRFYVGYDEFTADRPANRLIHLALQRLVPIVRHPANRQRLHQLRIAFSAVPRSTNLKDDWARHQRDRSMRQYDTVMPWIRLFLSGHGLATFAGAHVNRAMLFPMQDVFEDFVTAAVRRHQKHFSVRAQGPMRPLATNAANEGSFYMKPDIALLERNKVRFILDAKWKRLDTKENNDDTKYDIKQADVYQLFAYGRQYNCPRVALLYPQTTHFRKPVRFQFNDKPDLELMCFPFNVADPAKTVDNIIRELEHKLERD